jgi:hypothetical protein
MSLLHSLSGPELNIKVFITPASFHIIANPEIHCLPSPLCRKNVVGDEYRCEMLSAKAVISFCSFTQGKVSKRLTEQEPHPQLEQSPEHEQEAQLLQKTSAFSSTQTIHHGAAARPDWS